MKLDLWLYLAVNTFPQGVRERLTQEYKAHLEEHVAAGGSEDAEVLFGDPKIVKKNLMKSYIDLKALQSLGTQKDWFFWIFLALDSLILTPLSQTYTKCLTIFLVKLACYACLWLSTTRFSYERKRLFRNVLAWPIFLIPFFPSTFPDTSSHSGPIREIASLLIQTAIFIYLTRTTDLKLRRTLELERPIRERPYLGLYAENQT